MKTKEITISVIITALTKIESLWSLGLLVINKNTSKMDSTNTYYLWQIVSTIAIFLLAYFIVRYFNSIRKEIKALTYLNNIRYRRQFMKDYKELEYFKLPKETWDEFYSRLPNADFKKDIQNEISTLKADLPYVLDITGSESKKIIESIYIKKK